jgi:hypothetical protein
VSSTRPDTAWAACQMNVDAQCMRGAHNSVPIVRGPGGSSMGS